MYRVTYEVTFDEDSILAVAEIIGQQIEELQGLAQHAQMTFLVKNAGETREEILEQREREDA